MERTWLERIRGAGRASPAEVVLLAFVGIAIAGGSALVFFRKSEPPPPRIERVHSSAGTAETPPTSAAKPPPKVVLVHVAGMVAVPGVYELPDNSRVRDAVAAAGGPKEGADIDALNLAAPISDGQKIIVGKPGEVLDVAQASPGQAAAGPAAGGRINLNTASATDLDALPSIGPVLAQRILAFRQEKGGFTSVTQLKDVEGIGPKKYEGIKELVTV